jgi:hypothetical protein
MSLCEFLLAPIPLLPSFLNPLFGFVGRREDFMDYVEQFN